MCGVEVVPGIDGAADAVDEDVDGLDYIADGFCVGERIVVAENTSQDAELRLHDQLKCGV